MWASSCVRSVQNDADRQAMSQAFVMSACNVGTCLFHHMSEELNWVLSPGWKFRFLTVPHSGCPHFPSMPFFLRLGVWLVVLQWSVRIQSSEDRGRQLINGKKRSHCPWLVYGEFCKEDSERRKAIKWHEREQVEGKKWHEQGIDGWSGGWLEGEIAPLPPCYSRLIAVISFLLMLLVLIEPLSLTLSASSLHTPPALQCSNTHTYTHTHILLISLLPSTLAKTPPWDWLGWSVHA